MLQIGAGVNELVNVNNGLIATRNVTGIPEQPFAFGVTVILPIIESEVLFLAKKKISPDPLAGIPKAVLSFVQV